MPRRSFGGVSGHEGGLETGLNSGVADLDRAVREQLTEPAQGLVEQVKPKQYPPSRLPRPAKHHKDLAGHPATQEAPPSSGEADNHTEE